LAGVRWAEPALDAEPRVGFEDFAMVQDARPARRHKALWMRYHLFEQKNSGP
jgi:hypothetical protein